MKEINLNHDMYINIDSLSCGTTDLKVKISRNYYFVRVEKNKINSYIDIKVQDGDFKKRFFYKKQCFYIKRIYFKHQRNRRCTKNCEKI